MPTKSPSGLRTSKPSRLTSDTLTITLQEPCFQGILLSHYLSFLWLQRAGCSMGCSCGKTIFQALFFSALFLETQTSPALQENSFSGSKKLVFPHCSFETQRSFQALKNVFSALFFETQSSPALQENNFSGSKKSVFPHGSFETQRSSALQKNNFSVAKQLFFAH